MTQFSKQSAGLMVAMRVASEVTAKAGGKVDVYTIPEDGLVAVVIETVTNVTAILSVQQTLDLAAVGMKFDPEFTDEWTEGEYFAIVGTFGSS